MSKIKTPAEKKRLSLERDRRNSYGESPASSRKNIRKRRSDDHREDRRTANQNLSAIKSEPDLLADASGENRIREHDTLKKRKHWRKTPDMPLGEIIAKKASLRKMNGMDKRP